MIFGSNRHKYCFAFNKRKIHLWIRLEGNIVQIKKMDRPFSSDQNGLVLIVVLMLLLMLSLIGIASISNSNTEMDISGNELDHTEAFYLADAGIERAMTALNDSSTWRAGYSNVDLGHGSYSVTVIDGSTNPQLGNSIELISTGRVENSKSRIDVILDRVSPFRFAAFGRDSLYLGEESRTDSYNSALGDYASTRMLTGGDIGSNGIIDIARQTTINGNISTATAGGITLDPLATINGDTTSSAQEITLDPIPISNIDYARANNSASTGLTFSGGGGSYDPVTNALIVNTGGNLELAGGTYYFSSMNLGSAGHANCNITIAPGQSAVIYVDGDITFAVGVWVNSGGIPGNLQIYSTGSTVTINEESIINAALYAPDAQINLIEESNLYGSFVGGAINSLGLNDMEETYIHYDQSLGDFGAVGHFYVSSWRNDI